MSVLVCLPIYRVSCRVWIDKGRTWSVVDELLLWALTTQSTTLAKLVEDSGLPHQLVVTAVARLMRFRLVEGEVRDQTHLRVSDFGRQLITSGQPLPYYPKRYSRGASFVTERVTGQLFSRAGVRCLPRSKVQAEIDAGADVRIIEVVGGGPAATHEAMLNRLGDVVARGWDEQIANIDGRTASMRDDELMVVRVLDGTFRDLPESASPQLRKIIQSAADNKKKGRTITIPYAGPKPVRATVAPIACHFDPNDLVIGGPVQRAALLELFAQADRRVILHSTFLLASCFEQLLDPIRAACARGVTLDMLWGASHGDDAEARYAAEAAAIATIVREDALTRGKVHVRMKSTGSHAKVLLADRSDGTWIAAVSSCNWLKSPFQAVDTTVILRHPLLVAAVAEALQRLVGRSGLSDDIATEMALVARDLRKLPVVGGDARIAILAGDAHEAVMRTASGTAANRLVIGSHRLGSTARPGALLPGEQAASRPGITPLILYSLPSGPLKKRHARQLREEADKNGVRLINAGKILLHGKFLAWDDDDLVVTSLNWASASADPDFALGEIGVHIQAPGVADTALTTLAQTFPDLGEGDATAAA